MDSVKARKLRMTENLTADEKEGLFFALLTDPGFKMQTEACKMALEKYKGQCPFCQRSKGGLLSWKVRKGNKCWGVDFYRTYQQAEFEVLCSTCHYFCRQVAEYRKCEVSDLDFRKLSEFLDKSGPEPILDFDALLDS